MKLISMFFESIRVANRLENAGSRAGLEKAQLFVADYCGSTSPAPSQNARSAEYDLIDGAFMKPF